MPNCFIGTILGTAGHSAAGSSEKAMPSTHISVTASQLELSGMANTMSTAVSITLPTTIIVAPRPLLSHQAPNNGVSTIDVKGRMAGIIPANSAFTPYLEIISLVAKSRKG